MAWDWSSVVCSSDLLCRNLDFWSMREETLANQIAAETDQAEIIITEGVMGLFDGASTGSSANAGSTADAAKSLDRKIVWQGMRADLGCCRIIDQKFLIAFLFLKFSILICVFYVTFVHKIFFTKVKFCTNVNVF